MSIISSGGSSVDVVWEAVDVEELLSVVDSVEMFWYDDMLPGVLSLTVPLDGATNEIKEVPFVVNFVLTKYD